MMLLKMQLTSFIVKSQSSEKKLTRITALFYFFRVIHVFSIIAQRFGQKLQPIFMQFVKMLTCFS